MAVSPAFCGIRASSPSRSATHHKGNEHRRDQTIAQYSDMSASCGLLWGCPPTA
jgi:hypothetical protein